MDNLVLNSTSAITNEVNLWQILTRRWLPATLISAGVFLVLGYRTLNKTTLYTSDSLILVADEVSVPVLPSQDGNSQTRDQVRNLSTDIEILKSPVLLSKAIRKLSPSYQTLSINQIASNLTLRQPLQTNVLSLSYQDTDRVRAKVVLEALVKTYLDYSQESRRSPLTNSIRLIEEKLPEAKKQLEQSSLALNSFRVKYELTDAEKSATLAFQNKQELTRRAIEAEVTLNQTVQQYTALKKQMSKAGQNPETSIIDSVLSQDQGYQLLLTQQAQIELQYAQESLRFTSKHPIIIDLQERRAKIKQLLQEQAQKVIGSRQSQAAAQNISSGAIGQELAAQLLKTQLSLETQKTQLQDLRRLATEATQDFQKTVQLEQEYRELENQYKFNAQAVADFSTKLRELRIQEAQDISKWKVIEWPEVPSTSSSPSVIKSLIPAGIASLIAGAAVAYLLEKTDRRLRNIQEVKTITSLPIVGVLPEIRFQKKPWPTVPLGSPEPFADALLTLALSFVQKAERKTSKDARGRVLAITSAVAEEGKTTIVYKLALALTELGQRTLVVDTDFTRPKLHQLFDLPNSSGLSTAFSEQSPWQNWVHSRMSLSEKHQLWSLKSGSNLSELNSEDHEVLTFSANKKVGIYPDILTAGPPLLNSSSWVVSEKLTSMLEEWRDTYDYILIDTASLTQSASTYSLISRVDKVILVVSLKHTIRSLLKEIMEKVSKNENNNLCIVINSPTKSSNSILDKIKNLI